MEILIGILGLVLIVAFVARDRSSRTPQRRTPRSTRPASPKRQAAPARRPQAPGGSGPFDATKAHPQHKPRVLKGPAWIVDGDTLTISKTQIRLFGIDAPEMDHPYGKKAKWALKSLCDGHHVEARILEVDTHGRTVALCTLPDGRDLSAEMVKLGLAIDWPKYSGGVYTALERPDVRRKLWLADARQKGRMDVWERYAAQQAAKAAKRP